MNTQHSLSARLIGLGAAMVIFMLAIYTYSSSSTFPHPPLSSSTFHFRWPPLHSTSPSRVRGSCSPSAWNKGHWEYSPRTNLTSMTRKEDALEFAGFEGCASDREFFWHLASDREEQWNRWPKVSQWKWTPERDCNVRPLDGMAMVRDMAEGGGWLLLGDSITEAHFFSLSCILYPHVRATPNYTENPYFERFWPQHLYLNPSSPLIPTLHLPTDFSIEKTPLVTFRRVDLLLSQKELEDLHKKLYDSPSNFSLFSGEKFWSLSPKEYMPLFTSPTPQGNYGTLIVNTAGHWTTTLLHGFRDESKADSGYGIDDVLDFFEEAMKVWAKEVQEALDQDRRDGSKGVEGARKVVVRSYMPGHEDCRNIYEPWKEWKPYIWNSYNWAWIKDFNQIFQELLSSPSLPDIHYVTIDRPALLRPDGHVSGDCLHIMTGAGIMEGWSHYIWHFVTRELKGGIR